MSNSQRKTILEILGRESVHPFPARMAPDVALDAMTREQKSLKVLDPMMGSGTVLAVARSCGHSAIGVDIDPLAVLISRVWTARIERSEARRKAAEVLARAKINHTRITAKTAYPESADDETRQFLDYWFDSKVRRQLASLAIAIQRVRSPSMRDILWCGFSRLIIAKQGGVSLALDLSHSRPHKSFDVAPTTPFVKFLSAVERVIANSIDARTVSCGPSTQTFQGDARSLPLTSACVDLVVTSPPYLNAIDYMRCSKFALVWMGHNVSPLRDLRSRSVGSEARRLGLEDDPVIRQVLKDLRLRPKLSRSDEAMLARYIDDMCASLSEASRVLVTGGRAVYVVGENTIRGTYVRNSVVIAAAAERSGLRLERKRSRTLPPNRRYLPPPEKRAGSEALNSRMRKEVILSFQKG